MCKIRARLTQGGIQRQEHGHEWDDEADEQVGSAVASVPAPSFSSLSNVHEEPESVQECSSERIAEKRLTVNEEQTKEISAVSNLSFEPSRSCKNPLRTTIEEAIGDYLEAQQQANRRPKTMEWHQTALGLFGQYLQTECQVVLLAEMTERHVHGWL